MMNNEQVSFQVADALNQPFPDGKFDLVWSMESGEHMPDKLKVQFTKCDLHVWIKPHVLCSELMIFNSTFLV